MVGDPDVRPEVLSMLRAVGNVASVRTTVDDQLQVSPENNVWPMHMHTTRWCEKACFWMWVVLPLGGNSLHHNISGSSALILTQEKIFRTVY